MTCEAPNALFDFGSIWHHEETGLLLSCKTTEPHTILASHTMLSEMKTVWPHMYGHCIRTASIARGMAHKLGRSPEETDTLTLAALLHDYGKTALHDQFDAEDTDFFDIPPFATR